MEGDEADALYGEFVAAEPAGDLDRFLAWLYQQGHVGSETFRALHVHGDLTLVTLDDLARGPELVEDGVEDRFAFLGVLGRGAMGEIHVARERDLRRKVALKFLLPERSGNPTVVRRFFREIQITAQLEHPNIVPIYALETEDGGVPACSMKLIQGRTLRDYIKEAGALAETDELDEDHSLTTRLEHFLKVCDAIAYAHDRGIVHRDLKPSNVMIGPYNEVYVMDWGIAKPVNSEVEDDLSGIEIGAWSEDPGEHGQGGAFETRVGTVVGTPHYMAPEQAMGEGDLDERADQYALGLILHELVTLDWANPGEEATEAIEAAMAGEVSPMIWPEKTGRLPPELEAIVGKATERDRADRYASVEALSDDLRRYLRLFNGVSTISPLLGLLGTVLGMIRAFNAIATADAMGRPELLAGGISQALLTTAAGLSVAIPAYIAYLFFASRVDRLIIDIDALGQDVVTEIASDTWKDDSDAKSAKTKQSSKAA